MNRRFDSVPIGGPFGISVELNRLDDVIDYEEGRIVLTHGYPRFVPHSTVQTAEATARAQTGRPYAVAFPSAAQARFALTDFALRRRAAPPFELTPPAQQLIDRMFSPSDQGAGELAVAPVQVGDLFVACLKEDTEYRALNDFRRTIGSGFDVHQLAGQDVDTPRGYSATGLVSRLAELEGPGARGSCLFQSGMAAITTLVYWAVCQRRRFVLIGPAYVDTGTIGGRWAAELPGLESVWLPEDVTLDEVEAELRKGPAVVFFELPTNPRLTLPQVPQICSIARRYDTVLAADATLATPYNWRPLEHGFDLVMHSTSKYLGGKCDHLGGVLTTGSTEILGQLEEICEATALGMCANQQKILFENLQGFAPRMKQINQNARIIVDRLLSDARIGPVYYPGLPSAEQESLAHQLLRPGRSGLLSFVLADDSLEALRSFYDRVGSPIAKGPGLGAETTMLCPYVMLAHYRADAAFLAQQGLAFHLVRISVGTEPVETLWSAIERAL